MNPPMLHCPLCSHSAAPFWREPRRAYFRCVQCELVFADPDTHLDPVAERKVYDCHENHPDDLGYRRFLNRLAQPLLLHLEPGMSGLDYGSGPGPTLCVMLEESGMRMAIFDPFYAPDRSVLLRTYDFVTCTEVVEHFHRPAEEWARLVSLLRPGGWLGIMTKQVLNRERFATWHYKNDPTHVCFYSAATWNWLANNFGLRLKIAGPDVILLQSGLPGTPIAEFGDLCG